MENTLTVNALISKFSIWNSKHRAPRSCEWYANYLNNFLAFPGIAEIEADKLKPYNISEWVDSKEGWGDNYRRGAIIAIQRVYNWAIEMGYLESSPIRKVPKPPAKRREIYMKPDDFQEIMSLIPLKDPFHDFVTFVWLSGSRPQEARHIEKRHFEPENERIVFPADESKGKRVKRIIYLHGDALAMITRLAEKYPEGKIFRNSRGGAWTKFAVCLRFRDLSKKIGRRMFCYAQRHGFATRKLIQGHDSITVAALMGHQDSTMLNRVYSHITDNTAHLKRALAD